MSSTVLETVDLRVEAGVARLTLNRPQSLNAWNPQFGQEMQAALRECGLRPEIRAVLITGAGRAFSSGADLKQGGIFDESGHPDVLGPLREHYNPVMLMVRELPKPVLAAVNGAAVGIGAALALACDLVIAAEDSYFLFAFANIGLALDGGASALLLARAGLARSSEIALLGERLSASQALNWGIVNRVLPAAELDSAAAELAARLAQGATGSYAAIKQSLNRAAYPDLAQLIDHEAVLQQQRAESADFLEGVTAFTEKRQPSFTGR